MGFIKELFDKAENGALTYEQFEQACKGANIKLANLSTGEYVSKQKYDDDISTRDTDLKNVQKQLEKVNGDSEKLKTVTADLEKLQGKYEAQAYEFSVKEYANSKKFTSNAAKRDFVNSMIAKNLKVENGKIIGADDFVTAYSADNADAFVTEKSEEPKKPVPQFVGSTVPTPQANKITKEQFAKMGYTQRNELYQSDRELYNQLSKE